MLLSFTLKWLVNREIFCPLVPDSGLAIGLRFGSTLNLAGAKSCGMVAGGGGSASEGPGLVYFIFGY